MPRSSRQLQVDVVEFPPYSLRERVKAMIVSHTPQEALRALKQGQPVVFPTDTLYGLGVSVEHAPDHDVLYQLKDRDKRKPIAWLVGGVEDLGRYGKIVPDFAFALARTFWPGPLTLIVKASDLVPEAFRSAEGTIGMRMPDNRLALDLIAELGCPIATTSANLSGQKPTKSFDEISPDLLSRVGAAVSDDEVKSGIASTIVDCTTGHPVLKRVGAITVGDIQSQA